MALRLARLRTFPEIFRRLAGLRAEEFDAFTADLRPSRGVGRRPGNAGRPVRLDPPDQLLLAVRRVRHHLTQKELGALFGVSDTTALRVIDRWLPALENIRFEGVRHPANARSDRRPLSALLADIPELAALLGGEPAAGGLAPPPAGRHEHLTSRPLRHPPVVAGSPRRSTPASTGYVPGTTVGWLTAAGLRVRRGLHRPHPLVVAAPGGVRDLQQREGSRTHVSRPRPRLLRGPRLEACDAVHRHAGGPRAPVPELHPVGHEPVARGRLPEAGDFTRTRGATYPRHPCCSRSSRLLCRLN